MSKDHFSDEQAQELLYKGKDSFGYARLKSKVLHDMLNTKMYSDCFKRSPALLKDPEYHCNHLISQAQLLRSIKAYEQAINLLKEGLNKAHQYKLKNYRNIIIDMIKDYTSEKLKKISTMEIIFYNSFYKHDYKQAEEIVTKYFEQNNGQLENADITTAKFQYFKANLEFVKGSFTEDILSNNSRKILRKDGPNWLLGISMLEMLNIIELEDYALLSCKLDCYRKLLDRYKCARLKRYKCIKEIINALCKESRKPEKVNFQKVIELQNRSLQLLQHHKAYKWKPYGYEIICFEKWLLDKSNSYQKTIEKR